jgi:hypothetical protein
MVSRISSAVLVHTNGRGFWFQLSIQAWIDAVSSATERWVPCLSHLLVSSANQRSTRFSQELPQPKDVALLELGQVLLFGDGPLAERLSFSHCGGLPLRCGLALLLGRGLTRTVARELRACASRRSWAAARAAVPAIVGPGAADEPATDDGGISQR